jgi:hypothetical protein
MIHNRMQQMNAGDYHVYRRVRCVVYAARRVGLHVKCSLLLSYLNKNINFAKFRENVMSSAGVVIADEETWRI